MAAQTLMFKMEAAQAANLSGMAGKTYTVGKVSAVGTGMNKWLFLQPVANKAGAGTVALKIEGGRQLAQIGGLVGKTVTVGKTPTIVGGVGAKYLVLHPAGSAAAAAAAAAAGTAGAGKAAAASGTMMMKLEGTRQAAQMKALGGKTFTVVKSPMMAGTAKNWLFMKPAAGAVAGKEMIALQVQNGAGNMGGMIGKTYTLTKAPIATNVKGAWVLMKPATATGAGTAAKAAASIGAGGMAIKKSAVVAAKPTAAAPIVAPAPVAPVAKAAPAAKAAAVAKSTGAASSGGTIWTGSGWKLGLGWGLGAWGPAILAGGIAAVGYGVYQYYQRLDDETELVEAEG